MYIHMSNFLRAGRSFVDVLL